MYVRPKNSGVAMCTVHYNIPLQEIPNHVDEFRNREGAIVLCCASGIRSDRAMQFLRQQGIANVHNGGSWYDLSFLK